MFVHSLAKKYFHACKTLSKKILFHFLSVHITIFHLWHFQYLRHSLAILLAVVIEIFDDLLSFPIKFLWNNFHTHSYHKKWLATNSAIRLHSLHLLCRVTELLVLYHHCEIILSFTILIHLALFISLSIDLTLHILLI